MLGWESQNRSWRVGESGAYYHHFKAYEILVVNVGAREQARLLTAVLRSVVAQEQANSIAEGSAAA